MAAYTYGVSETDNDHLEDTLRTSFERNVTAEEDRPVAEAQLPLAREVIEATARHLGAGRYTASVTGNNTDGGRSAFVGVTVTKVTDAEAVAEEEEEEVEA